MFLKRCLRNLFLVKEIKSKAGEVHFQRYRLFQSRWFAIYLHFIAKSDADKHPHNHPWNFVSFVLSGGYFENVWDSSIFTKLCIEEFFCVDRNKRTLFSDFAAYRDSKDFHQVEIIKPTWTLVFTGRRINENWGYLTESGFKNNIDYRKEKNEANNQNTTKQV